MIRTKLPSEHSLIKLRFVLESGAGQTRSFISAIRPKCGGSYPVSKRSYLESEYSFQICHCFIPGSHREREERKPRRIASRTREMQRCIDLLSHIPKPWAAPFPDGGFLERFCGVGSQLL